jgi:hypothetical protein
MLCIILNLVILSIVRTITATITVIHKNGRMEDLRRMGFRIEDEKLV